MLDKVVTQPKVRRFPGIEVALRPILICLWIFGIPVRDFKDRGHKGNANQLFYVLIWSWGLLLFSFNLGANLYDSWVLMKKSSTLRATRDWNEDVNYMNCILATLPSHFAWLAITVPKWNNSHNGLLDNLVRMGKFGMFHDANLQRFRRISITAVVPIMALTIGLIGLWIYGLANDSSYEDGMINYKVIYLMYPVAGAIVFCSLCRMISILLGNLSEDMSSSTSGSVSAAKLEEWQDRYQMIGDLVEAVNRCFGCLLLIFVAFEFVWMVNSSFKICTMGFNDNSSAFDFFVYLSFEILGIVAFAYLVSFSSTIKNQGWKCAVELRRIRPADLNLRTQVQNVAMEMSISVPRITAVGLFDVDLSLIPTLFGTTLTYLLILCQFLSSEKDGTTK